MTRGPHFAKVGAPHRGHCPRPAGKASRRSPSTSAYCKLEPHVARWLLLGVKQIDLQIGDWTGVYQAYLHLVRRKDTQENGRTVSGGKVFFVVARFDKRRHARVDRSNQLIGIAGEYSDGTLQNQDGVINVRASAVHVLSLSDVEVRSHDFH